MSDEPKKQNSIFPVILPEVRGRRAEPWPITRPAGLVFYQDYLDSQKYKEKPKSELSRLSDTIGVANPPIDKKPLPFPPGDSVFYQDFGYDPKPENNEKDGIMSYMEVYVVEPNGGVSRFTEFKNAWLGAATVWDCLGRKYLGTTNDWKAVFALQKDSRLSECELFTLFATFDNVIIGKEHFEYARAKFEEFNKQCDSHFRSLSTLLQGLEAKGYLGFCFNQTSVNSSPWEVWEGEDDCRPYNINVDTKHWFLTDEILKRART